MVTDILTYIGTYDEIRSACGLSSEELKDSELALNLYRNKLHFALNGISGVYTGSSAEETLETIFDRIDPSDEMVYAIQLFSIMTVSAAVMSTVGLRAYKSRSDGKASLVRFSPESAYFSALDGIRSGLGSALKQIYTLLNVTVEDLSLITAVVPDEDIVLGE